MTTLQSHTPLILSHLDPQTPNFTGTQDAGVDEFGIQAIIVLDHGKRTLLRGEVKEAALNHYLKSNKDVLFILADKKGEEFTVQESVLVISSETRVQMTKDALKQQEFTQRYEAMCLAALNAYVNLGGN